MPVETRAKRKRGNLEYLRRTGTPRPPLLTSLAEFKKHLAERSATPEVFYMGDEGYERAANAVRASAQSGVCEGRKRWEGLPNYWGPSDLQKSNAIVLGPRGGFAIISKKPGDLYVSTLCGKGDGTGIMHRVRDEARKVGASVTLDSGNEGSSIFYRKLGMREIDVHDQTFRWNA